MTDKVLSEDLDLLLEDFCETCGLSESRVLSYVEEGVISVQGEDVKRWRFSEVNIVQVQKADRLERELRLNPAGVALALELMSEIEDLKNQLKRLQRTSQQE